MRETRGAPWRPTTGCVPARAGACRSTPTFLFSAGRNVKPGPLLSLSSTRVAGRRETDRLGLLPISGRHILATVRLGRVPCRRAPESACDLADGTASPWPPPLPCKRARLRVTRGCSQRWPGSDAMPPCSWHCVCVYGRHSPQHRAGMAADTRCPLVLAKKPSFFFGGVYERIPAAALVRPLPRRATEP